MFNLALMYKKLKLKGKDPQNFSIVNLFYVHAQIVKNANSLVRLPLKSGIYLYMVKNVSHLFFLSTHYRPLQAFCDSICKFADLQNIYKVCFILIKNYAMYVECCEIKIVDTR